MKKTSLNNYLILRGTTWHLHWNVPRGLRSNPLFRGKAIYSTTLRTKDVHEARQMRDKLVGKFTKLVEVSAAQQARQSFLAHYAEASKAAEEAKQKLVYLDGWDAFNVMDGLGNAFDVESAIEKGDFARADAYLAALYDQRELAEKYAMTLKEVAAEFIKEHEGTVASSTLSKVKVASASLLKSIGNKDTKLKDVTDRQVTRWIKAIASESSDNTRAAYIASLSKMWHWAWENEHVDGTNPFKGIKLARQGDEASYIPFEIDELKAIVELADPAMKELARFGLITGCRISELVNLKPANFLVLDGVHAIQIFEGKTDASIRTIPLPAHLWEALKQCVADEMWKGTVESSTQRFSKIKTKAMGRADRKKVFHSFRHMAATAYEQAHIEERISSVMIGHKNKRGQTLTYGLYSAGLNPKQYLEAVEKMLDTEYMQSYLKLFPQ